MIGDGNRRSQSCQANRKPLIPENVLERQRHGPAVFHSRAEMGEPRHQLDRTVAGVGEPSLGRDPQGGGSGFKDRRALLQERRRAAGRVQANAVKTELAEHAVLFQRLGIDRCVELTVGKERAIEKMGDHRIPPGRMVRVHDQRCSIPQRRLAPRAAVDRNRMKVPLQERPQETVEAVLQPAGDMRDIVFRHDDAFGGKLFSRIESSCWTSFEVDAALLTPSATRLAQASPATAP